MMKAQPQEIFQFLCHRLINSDLEERFLNPSLMAFSTSLSKSNQQAQTQTAHQSKLPVVIKLGLLIILKLITPFSSESSRFAQLRRQKSETSPSNQPKPAVKKPSALSVNNKVKALLLLSHVGKCHFSSNFSDVSKTYFSQFMIFKPIYIPIEYQQLSRNTKW